MTTPPPAIAFGSLRLPHPFFLAPLAGYSGSPMRVISRRFGACLTFSEMLLDSTVLGAKKKLARFFTVAPDDHPIVCQVIGNDPAMCVRAVRRLLTYGYDAVELNLACPVRKVLGKRRGGYALQHPAGGLAVARALREAFELPLSVKLRCGWDDSAESRQRFWDLAEGLVQIGVDALAIHGRTVQQHYRGRADWGVVAEAKRRFGGTAVFGSGDLSAPEAAVAMLEQSGCDAVLLARGAIGNPWIFREALALWRGEPKPPRPTLAEQAEVISEHVRRMVEYLGPRRGPRVFRHLGICYSRCHPAAKRVRAAFIAIQCPAEAEAILDRFYRNPAAGEALG
jgi:nifR3 family TIM-barrel protein